MEKTVIIFIFCIVCMCCLLSSVGIVIAFMMSESTNATDPTSNDPKKPTAKTPSTSSTAKKPTTTKTTKKPDPPPAPPKIDFSLGNSLQQGGTIEKGKGIKSMNGTYTLVMQDDGNLVLTAKPDSVTWSTGTWHSPGAKFIFQNDGNLVIYDAENVAKWSTETFEITGGKLVMQDDGNLVLYDWEDVARWSSWSGVVGIERNWSCKKGNDMISSVTINWGYGKDQGNGTWACNSWVSKCENQCVDSNETNWECKKDDVSKGKIAIQWEHTKEAAKWACNSWKTDCDGQCKASPAAKDVTITETRDAGVLANGCPAGKYFENDLCYDNCRAGYSGAATKCLANCPSGFTTNDYFCGKPSAYGRGAGYKWEFGDWLKLEQAEARCRKDHPEGCERNGEVWYPVCKPGFHQEGCCLCTPDCPSGFRDDGATCWRPDYDRGVGTSLTCPAGTARDANDPVGLCYKPCSPGFHGVGPVCHKNT